MRAPSEAKRDLPAILERIESLSTVPRAVTYPREMADDGRLAGPGPTRGAEIAPVRAPSRLALARSEMAGRIPTQSPSGCLSAVQAGQAPSFAACAPGSCRAITRWLRRVVASLAPTVSSRVQLRRGPALAGRGMSPSAWRECDWPGRPPLRGKWVVRQRPRDGYSNPGPPSFVVGAVFCASPDDGGVRRAWAIQA